MLWKGKFILQLLCTFLVVQHGFQEAKAITQLKHQQMSMQSKPAQQIQPQPQQQQQQQQMQQQHQTHQQTNVQEKISKQETNVANNNNNQDSNLGNPFTLISDIKRDDHFSPSLLPFGQATSSVPQPSLPQSLPLQPTQQPSFPPPVPLPPSLPFNSAWNLNPFLNQRFSAPSPFSAQPYSVPPPFSLPQFSEIPFSASPYRMLPSFFNPQKYLPFTAFPQSFLMPYQHQPFAFPPPSEYFYSQYPGAINDFEDTTSRSANGRRPSLTNGRDSPIYYMRLPPTPYMFLPNFGYPTNGNSLNYGPSNYSPFLPFQAVPSYPGLGQTYNLPLNFLSNGKPNGIHSFLPDIENSSPQYHNFNGFNSRPLGPIFPGSFNQPSYNIPPPPPLYQDSKLTSLKQPFFFNGRPEDIYVLQNSINPLFSGL